MSEFARILQADEASDRPVERSFLADENERRALTKRLKVVDLCRLECRIRLARARGAGRYVVEGHVTGDVVMTCVVTLEPFEATIEEDFRVWLTERPADLVEDGEIFLAADEEDDVEPLGDGRIDVGELAVQYLALGLDPHPRSPQATLDALEAPDALSGVAETEARPEGTHRPFTVLERLKRR